MKDVPEWKRNVSASECILVNKADTDLIEILLCDGYHRQVIGSRLMSFDESLKIARGD